MSFTEKKRQAPAQNEQQEVINPSHFDHVKRLREVKDFYSNYPQKDDCAKDTVKELKDSLYNTVCEISSLVSEEFICNLYGERDDSNE